MVVGCKITYHPVRDDTGNRESTESISLIRNRVAENLISGASCCSFSLVKTLLVRCAQVVVLDVRHFGTTTSTEYSKKEREQGGVDIT